MGVKRNNLSMAVSKPAGKKRRKTKKKDSQYIAMIKSFEAIAREKRKQDEMYRIIEPSVSDMKSGAYENMLNVYCNSIYRMYVHIYEEVHGMALPNETKTIMKRIIKHNDKELKTALIFYTLVKELTFFHHFVPPPEAVFDSSSGTMVNRTKKPKVDVFKMQYFMENWAVPYTERLLNGRNNMNVYEYVRQLRLMWMISPYSEPPSKQ